MPLCSIVIPWYRGISDLRRAVDSVLAQDCQDFEIIVVANGVSDADYAEVETLYADPRYRVARLPVAGASSARNLGIKLATGKLIFLLDADDRFHKGKLSRFLALAETDPFDVAFSRGQRLRPNGVSWVWPVAHWDGRKPIAEFFFCDGCTISTSAIVIAADVKDRIPFGEDSRPYEDPDIILRADDLGLRVIMLEDSLYDYFDDRTEHRLSNKLNWTERLAWIDATPPNVSAKAKAAFRVRCVAQHLFPRKPFLCARLFWDALLKRAVPLRDLALFVIRGLIPAPLRHGLVNRYFAARAARNGQAERIAKLASKLSPAASTHGKPLADP